MTRAMQVLSGEQPVGQLREQDDVWAFEYSAHWSGFDLSPALPRAAGLIRDGSTNRPVQWYFDNLLPEDVMRTVLSQQSGIDSADAFGLLGYVGPESAGSLILLDANAPPLLNHGRRPLPQAELSRRIRLLPRVPINRDAPKQMSVAGAQHKLLVILEGHDLWEPIGSTASAHLLKPNHPEPERYAASVTNEYATMRLANMVGLDVPDVHRLRIPQPVYIVDRFDRVRAEGAAEYQRLHIIDSCQLLNKSRAFKYTAASVETLALAIDQCRSKARARQQLLRWLLFNVLVGNGDNHLKNLSFIVDDDGIELAPAYDLLSTAVYDTRAFADAEGRWPQTRLGIPLPGAPAFGDVRHAHLIAAGDALKLPKSAVRREIDRMRQKLPAAADQLFPILLAKAQAEVAHCPDPATAGDLLAGEARLLDCIQKMILHEMVRQSAP